MSDSNTTESDMSVEQGQAGSQEHTQTREVIDQQTDNGFAPESDSIVQPERETQFTPVAQLQPAFEGNISFASVGGTAAKRPQSGEPAPSPAPGTGREPGKHGLRNLIVSGGVVGTVGALATAAAITLFGGKGSSNEQHDPNSGSNGGVPTLNINTPEATQPPTVTPEKTPDPNKIFMSDARRINFGSNNAAALENGIDTRTECPDPIAGYRGIKSNCPAVLDIMSNPNIGEIQTVDNLEQARNDLFGIAWLRNEKRIQDQDLFKGNTRDEFIQNIEPFLEQYNSVKESNGGKVRINGIYAFTDGDGYESQTSTYIDSDYKLEYLFVSQPNKYTNIDLGNGYVKMGNVVNHDSKTVTLVIYDFAGGRGKTTGDPIQHGLADSMVNAGVAFADKTIQVNGKFEAAANYNEVRPALKGIAAQLQKSLEPLPYYIDFQGKTYTYYEGTLSSKNNW